MAWRFILTPMHHDIQAEYFQHSNHRFITTKKQACTFRQGIGVCFSRRHLFRLSASRNILLERRCLEALRELLLRCLRAPCMKFFDGHMYAESVQKCNHGIADGSLVELARLIGQRPVRPGA